MSDTDAEVLDWNLRHERKKKAVAPTPPPPASWQRPTGHDRYAEAAFRSEVDRLAAQRQPGRNDQLNRSGFALYRFVAAGRLPVHDVYDTLRSTALAIGLEEGEVEGTLRSAAAGGYRSPRWDNLPGEDTGATYEVNDLVVPPVVGLALRGFDVRPLPDGDDEEEPERTSWWPTPIGERVADDVTIPGPTHLVREDGQALLYSGKVNGLLGESESGKSWVALHAVVQALGEGQRVLFLDFEDSAESIFGRLSSMGASVNLGTLDYANPTEGLGLAQARDLREALDGHAYRLIVVDGVNAAMSILGYEINSNDDATKFAQKLLVPLAGTGACVVTVDHVPKASEQRGRGGIGAQAKRAMMTGCALTVEVVEPFGRGQSGELRLTVDKDRPGHVRGAANGTQAGRVILDSDGERVRIRIESTTAADTFIPTGVMQSVSLFIEGAASPPSFRVIDGGVSGRQTTVKSAVETLVKHGFVSVEPGPRGAFLHRSVRPYRKGDELTVPPSDDRLPPSDGRHTRLSVSHPPLPTGGGRSVEQSEDTALGWSSCNRCGEAVLDTVLDQTAGYCVPCGRVMNP